MRSDVWVIVLSCCLEVPADLVQWRHEAVLMKYERSAVFDNVSQNIRLNSVHLTCIVMAWAQCKAAKQEHREMHGTYIRLHKEKQAHQAEIQGLQVGSLAPSLCFGDYTTLCWRHISCGVVYSSRPLPLGFCFTFGRNFKECSATVRTVACTSMFAAASYKGFKLKQPS